MKPGRSAFVFVLLLLCGTLVARGGDGGDYSGGDSDSSGSDYGSSSSSDYGSSSSSDYGSSSSDYGYSDTGGGGGESPAWVVIGLFVIVGVMIAAAMSSNRTRRRYLATGRVMRRPSHDILDIVRTVDPNFSPVLFSAFAHLVYVKYHESRGGLAPASADDYAVAPYLHPDLRKQLASNRQQIDRVIVGNVSVRNAAVDNGATIVEVEFKANLVVRTTGTITQRLLMLQQFVFRRPAGVMTRPPENVLALGCPSCGSCQEPDASGRCGHCGRTVGGGELDWQVVTIHSKPARVVSDPVGQGGGVEVGWDYATVTDPLLAAGERHLHMRDPAFSWDNFRQRVTTIFMKLQEGWTMRDENILRPYELDHVFDTHRIALERYREQGVRNVLDQIRIDRIEPARIEGDAWYDCITVRIFASMIDYNEAADGRLISGSRTAAKSFSEYFTLVRRASNQPRPSGDPLKCPQCGGPLDRVSQSGICAYCNSRLTTGTFDWVLAQITQDEEYGG